jgi:hypothetical protein
MDDNIVSLERSVVEQRPTKDPQNAATVSNTQNAASVSNTQNAASVSNTQNAASVSNTQKGTTASNNPADRISAPTAPWAM